MYNSTDAMRTRKWSAIHLAQTMPFYIGLVLFGLGCFSVITLEYLVALSTAEMIARDNNGVLSPEAARQSKVIAFMICAVGVFFLHKPVQHLMRKDSTNMMTVLLIGTLLVILSNPYLALVEDLRFGNSLGADAAQDAQFQKWLVGVGLVFRILFIGMAAIMATVGAILMIRGARGIFTAFLARREAKDLATADENISLGEAKVRANRRDAYQDNQDRSAQFTRGLIGGMLAMARTFERYEAGNGHLFEDPATWLEELQAKLEPTFTPTDPAIRQLVHDRLTQMSLPLTDLPDKAADLPEASRRDLLDYTLWLRNNADFNTIMAAVQLPKEDIQSA